MEELRIQAKQLKDEKAYDKAIEKYSQIYSPDCDKWVAWEYAHCLKRLEQHDRAIDICKTLYSKDKTFKYNNDLLAWLLFEKYFKEIKQVYSYEEVNLIYKIALFVSEIVTQDEETPYEKIMLKTLRILKKNSNNPDDKILTILEKIDTQKLSETAPKYKIKDKEQEYQSNKEMFYAYKTKALYNKKLYEECISCCEEALNTIEKFHHNNDIWIQSRKALCLGEMENVDIAINELKKLVAIKLHWIFYAEIARLYQAINDNINALLYFCRAAITSDPPQMKVTLYYEMAELINTLGDSNIANLHAVFAKDIREKEGWNISSELNALINETKKADNKQKAQIEILQEYWLSKIYETLGTLIGTISNIHRNGKFGFIKSGKESYYFKIVSILGRYRAKQGDKVIFSIIESFDKTKSQMTKEAVYIKLNKQ